MRDEIKSAVKKSLPSVSAETEAALDDFEQQWGELSTDEHTLRQARKHLARTFYVKGFQQGFSRGLSIGVNATIAGAAANMGGGE